MAQVFLVKQHTEIQVICVPVCTHNDIKFKMYMLYNIQCILLIKVIELLNWKTTYIIHTIMYYSGKFSPPLILL